MKLNRTLHLAVMIAGLLLVANPTANGAKKAKKTKSADVALTAKGTLQGLVVNRNNVPKANAIVEIINRKGQVQRVRTNRKGMFEAKLVKGGNYVVRTNGRSTPMRVWTRQLAPPKTRNGVLLVHDAKVVRAAHQHLAFLNGNFLPIAGLAGFAGAVGYDATRKGS